MARPLRGRQLAHKAFVESLTGEYFTYANNLQLGGKPLEKFRKDYEAGKADSNKGFKQFTAKVNKEVDTQVKKNLDNMFFTDREEVLSGRGGLLAEERTLSPERVEEIQETRERARRAQLAEPAPVDKSERFDVREQRLAQQRANAQDIAARESVGTGSVRRGRADNNQAATKADYNAARKMFLNRNNSPSSFLSKKEWDKLERAKRFISNAKGVSTPTRWDTGGDAYKEFDEFIKDYNKLVKKQALRMPASGRQDFLGRYIISRGHFNPKGSKLFTHQWDLDSNIAMENYKANIGSGAKMTFGEYLTGMELEKDGRPFILPGLSREIRSRIKSGMDGKLWPEDEASRNYLLKRLDNYTVRNVNFHDPKLVDMFDVPMLNKKGNFVTFEQMKESNPDLTRQDYESLRRLAITMFHQNPQSDLDALLRGEKDDFVKGTPHGNDGKRINARHLAIANNKGDTKDLFSKREKILKLARAAAKAGIPLAGLLAYSGATYALDDDASEADYIDHILSNLDKYDDKTVGAWERQVRKALPEEWAQAVDSFEASAVEKLDDPNAWWNPQVGGDRGTVGLGTGLQTAAEFAKYWLTEYPGAAVASVTEVPETIWNWINPAKASVQADQGSVPEETPYYDFGQHALPMNVVPVMPVANPALKYGGVVQSMTPRGPHVE